MDLTKNGTIKGMPLPYTAYCDQMITKKRLAIAALRDNPVWQITRDLTEKVDASGQYKHFYGDTTVFPMEEPVIRYAEQAQSYLRSCVPHLLADPLSPDTFHITVHDLNNPFNQNDEYQLALNVRETREKMAGLFQDIADYLYRNPGYRTVKLYTLGLVLGGTTGLSIDFLPASAADYFVLMNLHQLFDRFLYLPNPLRIHLSLNYFYPKTFSVSEIAEVLSCVTEYEIRFDVTLDIGKLTYQVFEDMNTYHSLFSVGDF
jgi:hypothetical protein